MRPYRGRFAPSPTGPLHAGSLVAALASWLDAKAHDGQWWVRIEDIDGPRCPPGTDQLILQQLAQCHLHPDAPVQWQSRRTHLYQAALDRLRQSGHVYACTCSRKDIAQALSAQGWSVQRHASAPYPGTCRRTPPDSDTLHSLPHAWRFAVPGGTWHWHDRWLGAQSQDIAQHVGDVVLRRADGPWAYQLAVVVDDAEQGITHVVRGQDLADNTPRQMALQKPWGWPHLCICTRLWCWAKMVKNSPSKTAHSRSTPASPWPVCKRLHRHWACRRTQGPCLQPWAFGWNSGKCCPSRTVAHRWHRKRTWGPCV